MAVYERNPITGEETIVAGIQDINGFETRLTNIEDMIPNDASSSNKLVDEGSLGTASAKDATDVIRVGLHDLVESNAVANAINQALSSIYVPRGALSCAELTSGLLIEANVGNVYEMSDSGTTSDLFLQGAGETISVGDNVGIIQVGESTYKFNLMANAFDLTDYQKKDLTTTVEGASTVEGALGALSTNKIDVSSGVCAHGTNEPFMAGQPIRTYLLGLDSSIKFATFTVDPTASTVTDKINTTEYFSYNCYKQGSSWRVVAINSNGNKMYIADVSSSTQGITWVKLVTESDTGWQSVGNQGAKYRVLNGMCTLLLNISNATLTFDNNGNLELNGVLPTSARPSIHMYQPTYMYGYDGTVETWSKNQCVFHIGTDGTMSLSGGITNNSIDTAKATITYPVG